MKAVTSHHTLRTLPSRIRSALADRSLSPQPSPSPRFGIASALRSGHGEAHYLAGARRRFATLQMAASVPPGVGYVDGSPSCVAAFVTVPDKGDEALRIAKILVEEKLVACVNVISGNQSVYMWEGALQVDAEKVLMMKTRAELAESLVKRVKEIHSYDTPEVIVLPIVAGSDAYLKWVAESTKAPSA